MHYIRQYVRWITVIASSIRNINPGAFRSKVIVRDQIRFNFRVASKWFARELSDMRRRRHDMAFFATTRGEYFSTKRKRRGCDSVHEN